MFARYNFYDKQHHRGKSFDHFLKELLIMDCNFDKQDEMVRDRIVFGTNYPAVGEKLINNGSDMTLDIVVDIAMTHELSQSELRAM